MPLTDPPTPTRKLRPKPQLRNALLKGPEFDSGSDGTDLKPLQREQKTAMEELPEWQRKEIAQRNRLKNSVRSERENRYWEYEMQQRLKDEAAHAAREAAKLEAAKIEVAKVSTGKVLSAPAGSATPAQPALKRLYREDRMGKEGRSVKRLQEFRAAEDRGEDEGVVADDASDLEAASTNQGGIVKDSLPDAHNVRDHSGDESEDPGSLFVGTAASNDQPPRSQSSVVSPSPTARYDAQTSALNTARTRKQKKANRLRLQRATKQSPTEAQLALKPEQAKQGLLLKIKRSSKLERLIDYGDMCVNELQKKTTDRTGEDRKYFIIITSGALILVEAAKAMKAARTATGRSRSLNVALSLEHVFDTIRDVKQGLAAIEDLPRMRELVLEALSAAEDRVVKSTRRKLTTAQVCAETSRDTVLLLLALLKEREVIAAKKKTVTASTIELSAKDRAKQRFLGNITNFNDLDVAIAYFENGEVKMTNGIKDLQGDALATERVMHLVCITFIELSKATKAAGLVASAPSFFADPQRQLCYGDAMKAIANLEDAVGTVGNLKHLQKSVRRRLSELNKSSLDTTLTQDLQIVAAIRSGYVFVLALAKVREQNTVAQEPAGE